MTAEVEARGGTEGDIRSLYFWSRSAFLALVVAGALWIALGAFRLYTGLKWVGLDSMTGSSQAESDIAWAIAFFAAAVVSFLIARLLHNDVVTIFSVRRFQVPREKLLVYSMLALPFGFGLAGVLLIMVNVKLSYPEFLPSHAEAYPEAMPGWMMVPREEPTPEAAPAEAPPAEAPPPGFEAMPVEGVPPPEPAPAPAPAPMAAYVEEVPEEAPGGVPEVTAEAVPPTPAVPGPPVAEAVVEEVPEEAAEFEAIVEEVPPGEAAEFEAIYEEVPPEEAPRDIKEAHEELLTKLLGK